MWTRVIRAYNSPAWNSLRNTSCHSSTNKCTVDVEKLKNVYLIGINRPEKRNAVDPATAKQLIDAFTQFESDSEASVAVLYGKGGTFCAGFDLSTVASVEDAAGLVHPGAGPMGPSRMCLSKPVIAAISGHAVAGGLELALWCDLRLVEETAVMGVYCRRFGVPLIDGGTVRLTKLIGLSRAMDLILTGRGVKATEAFDMGLANRVVKTGTAVGAAVELAMQIAKFPQKCMNADRLSAYYATFNATSQEDALIQEFNRGIKVIEEESIPGAKKFMDGIGRSGSFNLQRKPKL